MTNLRVRYREGQRLRAADLNDEQAYHTAMRRRHNLSHHGWGIVTGLNLISSEGGVKLMPGLAVDGYGRELIVPDELLLGWERLREVYNGKLDVWLLFDLRPAGPEEFARCQEEATLWLAPASEVDPRRPPKVDLPDAEAGPALATTDDPKSQWPVYLGLIDVIKESAQEHTLTGLGRPYIELIGQVVTDPSSWASLDPPLLDRPLAEQQQIAARPAGQVQMQLDSEPAGRPERFVVRLRDDNATWVDRLLIDRKGNLTLQGEATVEGELTIKNARHGVRFETLAPAPVVAAPWQVYHTVMPVEPPAANGAAQAAPPAPGKDKPHQFRFEIHHPGKQGEAARNQFVIGKAAQSKEDSTRHEFAPCLTVGADGGVIIHGNFYVDGQVVESPIQPDLSDPRFGFLLLESWLQGQGAGASQSDMFHQTQLALAIQLRGDFPNISTYDVRLTNVGNFNIDHIDVYEILTTEVPTIDLNLGVEKVKTLTESLPAGNAHVIDDIASIVTRRGWQLEQDTSFTLTVTAIGVAGAFFVQATDTITVTINKKP